MDYADFSMLFTGDAEEDELGWLIQNYSDLLDVDILKASHHGSTNGVTDDFLAAVTPERVVISAGVNATYKHPMPEAVEDYINATNDRVYCTNRQGTIRVYGFSNGSSRIYKQNNIEKSCVYDGTHY
jgi:competence protein ComEC